VSVWAMFHLRCLLTACLVRTSMQVLARERQAVRYDPIAAGPFDCTVPTVTQLFGFCCAARMYGLVGVCVCVGRVGTRKTATRGGVVSFSAAKTSFRCSLLVTKCTLRVRETEERCVFACVHVCLCVVCVRESGLMEEFMELRGGC
jgi:hypothetical protein